MSDCFHPHCGRDHSRPLCNRLSPAASFSVIGHSRPSNAHPHCGRDHCRPLFTNRPITRRKLLLVSAADESPAPLWHCSKRIQDRTHPGARRVEAARRIHDKVCPAALLVIRIRGMDLRTAQAPRWSRLGVPSRPFQRSNLHFENGDAGGAKAKRGSSRQVCSDWGAPGTPRKRPH